MSICGHMFYCIDQLCMTGGTFGWHQWIFLETCRVPNTATVVPNLILEHIAFSCISYDMQKQPGVLFVWRIQLLCSSILRPFVPALQAWGSCRLSILWDEMRHSRLGWVRGIPVFCQWHLPFHDALHRTTCHNKAVVRFIKIYAGTSLVFGKQHTDTRWQNVVNVVRYALKHAHVAVHTNAWICTYTDTDTHTHTHTYTYDYICTHRHICAQYTLREREINN